MNQGCFDLCGTNCTFFENLNSNVLAICGEMLLAMVASCLSTIFTVHQFSYRNNSSTNLDLEASDNARKNLMKILRNLKIGIDISSIFLALFWIIYVFMYLNVGEPAAMKILPFIYLWIFVLLILSNSCSGKFSYLYFLGTLCCLFALSAPIYDLSLTFVRGQSSRLVTVQFWLQIVLCALYAFDMALYCWRSFIFQQMLFEQFRRLNSEHITLDAGHSNANVLSRVLFWWTNLLMQKGHANQLTDIEELYVLPKELESSDLSRMLNCALKSTKYNNSLARSLNGVFGKRFYFLGLLKFIADALNFAGPLMLGYIVDFMQNTEQASTVNIQKLYVFSVLLFGSNLLSAIFSLHFSFQMNYMALKLRGVLISLIFEKLLNVSSANLSSSFTTGELTNFASVDTDRVVNFVRSFHDFWSLPMQICIALYLLYNQVNVAFLAGLAFVIILIPGNRWIAQKIGRLSTLMLHFKDARMKRLSEMLIGMRIVKFCAWENGFYDKITATRTEELKYLKSRKMLDALCVYLWASAPVVVAILTFSTYVLTGNDLTAAKVFTSLSLFNILIAPLNAFPWVIGGIVDSWISLKRLQKFFNVPNFVNDHYYEMACTRHPPVPLCIHNINFSWSTVTSATHHHHQDNYGYLKPSLSNISLIVESNKLIGIAGEVGSGKSSLFYAILGEMMLLDSNNRINVDGALKRGIAFVSQEAWLQRGTVRENILFGSSYDTAWYDQVVHACALDFDFQIMPNGDLTLVGEQGVSLSGGQKTRIALARAIYNEMQLYLFDDPLSSVDAKVAKHIFRNCFLRLLKNKTVLLASHNIKLLYETDEVIVLEKGTIAAYGKAKQVLPRRFPNDLIDDHDSKFNSDDSKETNDGTLNDNIVDNEIYSERILTLDEEREVGFVRASIYGRYLAAVGILLALIFTSLFLMQVSKNASDWWLSFWLMNQTSKNTTLYSSRFLTNVSMSDKIYEDIFIRTLSTADIRTRTMVINKDYLHSSSFRPIHVTRSTMNHNVYYYLSIYAIIIGLNTFFTLVRSFSFAFGGLRAARIMHQGLLQTILKAPCRFFDSTPCGRIINRFSSDVFAIDDSLPFQANRLVMYIFATGGTLFMICYSLPWFLVCIIPMTLLYFKIQNYYRRTTCELKRLCSVSLSPVFSHISDTINGLVIIRAFKRQELFIQRLYGFVNANQRAEYSNLACSVWLGVRLQCIGLCMIAVVVLIAIMEQHYKSGSPGLIGLAIVYALSITSILGGLLQSFTETEKEMVSVERVSDYTLNTPQEKLDGIDEIPPSYPSTGEIRFRKVSLQYDNYGPSVLKAISFVIHAGEKIGIVGRTGSGKSSLFNALFRTVEIWDGQIFLDGIDISQLPLKTLRSSLSIIPQSPFLFSGTLKDNLTMGLFCGPDVDFRLNWVVEKCGLNSLVEKLDATLGLNASVGEKGNALSIGEKQLVCLARALMIGAKVLCIDEATAHVDPETDRHIQRVLRSEFPSCTVLTIAHRIDTIMDYDRVMVMDQGHVVEFDSPENLLQNRTSLFYQLSKH